jgi:D-alanyl-D-alanine carboxypeptidase/D-alanyl-D-alanine-endopeptidase (penicillin-binding protein 4)
MTRYNGQSHSFPVKSLIILATMASRGPLAVLLAMATLVTMAPAVNAGMCLTELSDQLDKALNEMPLARSYVGMMVQTQAPGEDGRQTLYARHADQFFTPASNAKLLTTAAALHHLGADYRIRTSIHGSPGPGELTNLRVVGRGDPTIGSGQLTSLAAQVVNRGVAQVPQLVLQDAYFPRFATNPTWEWSDAQADYAAPVNSLIFNQNAVSVQVAPTQVGHPLSLVWPAPWPSEDWPVQNNTTTTTHPEDSIPVSLWRTGGDNRIFATGQLPLNASPSTFNLAVLDPAQQFARALVDALQRQGTAVARTEITTTAGTHLGPELAFVESPPLAELLIPTNQDSNNLYAEVLLKTLGVTYAEAPLADASTAGADAVAVLLSELGVNPATVRLADGSGLSRHNLVTPTALVATLQAHGHAP